MDDIELLIDLHRDGRRQGPGSVTDTRRAADLSRLHGKSGLQIADLGCGTGASTIVLAQELDATINAVDLFPDFLDQLTGRARHEGVAHRIKTHACSMDALPFAESSFDAIWSEGAIYNVGFANGIRMLRRFLKPGGVLAVSELTWLTDQRPQELDAHWAREYPEVDTASAKLAILEQNGYVPLAYFALTKTSWLEHYYRPLQDRFAAFLSRHGHSEAAQAIVASERREIELYERYADFVSYGYYIAQKLAADPNYGK
ncbi:MAG: methyltransferase domain-containing protein [Pseudomonadota bacterium]